MDRVVEVKVNGSYLTKDNQVAGVQGEANSTALRIEFDEGWDGFAKTITWYNAKGENPTSRVLTADILEDITESRRIYLTLIPAEALTTAGKCLFVIDGYVNGKRRKSVYGEMVVKADPQGVDTTVSDPTPSQAEQLQVQIESLLDDVTEQANIATQKAAEAVAAGETAAETAIGIVEAELNGKVGEAAESARSASASETAAKASETAAAGSASEAADSATSALTSASIAAQKADAASISADNAASAAQAAQAAATRAEEVVGGDFATKTDLAAAKQEAITEATEQSIPSSDKGAANGVATLGADALLAAAQRPKAGGLYRDDGTTTVEASLTEISTTLQKKVNPNLLDNWYFANPVNQRGQTTYTSSENQYSIDRWIKEPGTLTIADGYISLDMTVLCGIAQRIETDLFKALAGKTLTASVLYKDGQLKKTTFTQDSNYTSTDIWKGLGNEFGNILYRWSNGSPNFTYANSQHCELVAIKLELGSQQTLAHQGADGNWVLNEIPNYADMLERCQYYSDLPTTWVPMTFYVADFIVFTVKTHRKMRVNLNSANVTLDSSKLAVHSMGTAQTGFSFSVYGGGDDYVLIKAAKTGHGLSTAMLVVGNGGVYANANM